MLGPGLTACGRAAGRAPPCGRVPPSSGHVDGGGEERAGAVGDGPSLSKPGDSGEQPWSTPSSPPPQPGWTFVPDGSFGAPPANGGGSGSY